MILILFIQTGVLAFLILGVVQAMPRAAQATMWACRRFILITATAPMHTAFRWLWLAKLITAFSGDPAGQALVLGWR